MSLKQYKSAQATNLMSKSRKNFQSGTYSRISNRYNSKEDSLTDDDGERAGASSQYLKGLDIDEHNGSQVSPSAGTAGLGYSSKRYSKMAINEGQTRPSGAAYDFNQPGIGSFENDSPDVGPSGTSQRRGRIVELDDSVKIFQNGSCSLMHIDDDENVSDEDQPKKIPESAVLQEIPAVLCIDTAGFNARRGNALYSFTKNIDYSQITDQQKRRFLREKKLAKNQFLKVQQIVPDPSSVRTSFTGEEKENNVCSEFPSQHVKFVANRHAELDKQKVHMIRQPKPKSILKSNGAGGGNTSNLKPCVQNNVYESAQFQNKISKININQVGRGKGLQDFQNPCIEILDQQQIPVGSQTTRPCVGGSMREPLNSESRTFVDYNQPNRKGYRLPNERSGSKTKHVVTNANKFSQEVTRNGSKTRLEARKSAQDRRKNASPTVPSEGKRATTKSSMIEASTFIQPKFSNYDVNAHRNVWNQYGKKDTFGSKKQSTTIYNQVLKKQNQTKQQQSFGLAQRLSPRDNSLKKKQNEKEKTKVAFSRTISGAPRSNSKARLRKQKSQEKCQKNTDKVLDNNQANQKNEGSGYMSARENNRLPSSYDLPRKLSKKRVGNGNQNSKQQIRTASSEQSLRGTKRCPSNQTGVRDNVKMLGSFNKAIKDENSSPDNPFIAKNKKKEPDSCKGNRAQKLNTIQIDLVCMDSSDQQVPEVLVSKDGGKMRSPTSHDLTNSIEEKLTARGSMIPTGANSKERPIEYGQLGKVDDMQQEKHKIWMQSNVHDYSHDAEHNRHKSEALSDPFKPPMTDSKFSLTDSESEDPYLRKNNNMEAKQLKMTELSIEQSLEKCDLALTTESDLKLQAFESTHKEQQSIEMIENQMHYGPQRASKINRRSKGNRNEKAALRETTVSVHDCQKNSHLEQQPENTNRSLTYQENADDFEEFSKGATTPMQGTKMEDFVRHPSSHKKETEVRVYRMDNMKDGETPVMNKTVTEKTLCQNLLLEGQKSNENQSSSEITQFNQKDYASSQLDDTQMHGQQSRNLSNTMNNYKANTSSFGTNGQISSTISPDRNKRSRLNKDNDVILMINDDQGNNPNKNKIDYGQVDSIDPSKDSNLSQYRALADQATDHQKQVKDLYSPNFGGSNKVQMRQSVQNSGQQSVPNSLPQSSSGADSTRIIDEEGQNRNSIPRTSSCSTNAHGTSCKCEECIAKQDLLQRNIENIPFDSIYSAAASPHRASHSDLKINFDALFEQYQILQQIRDLIEIRPSTVQNYSNLKSSFHSSQNQTGSILENTIPSTQAIEGLTIEERIKIQTLCQEWWDSTQEDNSVFRMALAYQTDLQENYYRSSMQDRPISQEERNILNTQNYERSQCMRKQVVLSSVVIGMTAFFSMLTRHGRKDSTIVSCDSTVKQDLELRTRMSQLIKILYDQSMLCMSYALGRLAQYDRVTKQRQTAEFKLHNVYNEYIHLLFINKKIQTEDDYQIFNTKGLMPQYPPDYFINNEENRDFQLSQLSRRLQENCFKILDQEIQTQRNAQNNGNVDLLCVLRDIVEHSSDIDFQEGKNHIFEGISNSEVLKNNNNVSQCSGMPTDENEDEETELIQVGGGSADNQRHGVEPAIEQSSGQSTFAQNHLVKTFKDDINQIIQEESREESMSVSISIINSSKLPLEGQGLYSQHTSVDRSGLFNQAKTPGPLHISQSVTSHQTGNGEIQNDFDKMIEIQENGESDHEQLSFDQIGRKDHDYYKTNDRDQTLKLDDTDLRIAETVKTNSIDFNSNDIFSIKKSSFLESSIKNMKKYTEKLTVTDAPTFVRVSTLSCNSEFRKLNEPYLPRIKEGFKYTLVLDLEETLIHCKAFSNFDNNKNQMALQEQDLLVYKRPGLDKFLTDVSKLYEIVIFTHGPELYAQKLVSKCIGQHHVDHILSAEHLSSLNKQEMTKVQREIYEFYRGIQICSSKFGSSYLEPCDQTSEDNTLTQLNTSEGGPSLQGPSVLHNMAGDFNLAQERTNSIKDLSKLGRDLNKVLIIDNQVENFGMHLRNGICISEYVVDRPDDTNKEGSDVLTDLAQMLTSIHAIAENQSDHGPADLKTILQEQLKDIRNNLQQKSSYFY